MSAEERIETTAAAAPLSAEELAAADAEINGEGMVGVGLSSAPLQEAGASCSSSTKSKAVVSGDAVEEKEELLLAESLNKNLMEVIDTQATEQLAKDSEEAAAGALSPNAHARLEGQHSQELDEWVQPRSPHEHDDREVQLYATGLLDMKRKRPVYEVPEPEIARKMKRGPTHMQTLSQFKRGPKYTMGVKIKFGDPMAVDEQKGPAPGTYSIKDTANSKVKGFPTISFGKGRRFPKRLEETPAPGEYEPGELGSSYRVTFGNAPRDKKDHKHREPGPGTYEFRSTVGLGPRFTARGRKGLSKSASADLAIPGYGVTSW
mmetsp:Transcript_17941/g.44804  ORF Transcript_17941/g.44804 Transcript_17941/m.44804 type:complete len:319 (+) Transcript_17941:190-1146(+)